MSFNTQDGPHDKKDVVHNINSGGNLFWSFSILCWILCIWLAGEQKKSIKNCNGRF